MDLPDDRLVIHAVHWLGGCAEGLWCGLHRGVRLLSPPEVGLGCTPQIVRWNGERCHEAAQVSAQQIRSGCTLGGGVKPV
jgi:hypothetical protein